MSIHLERLLHIALSLFVILALMVILEPSRNVAQGQDDPQGNRSLDLAGNGVISGGDGWSIAGAWADVYQDGECIASTFVDRDINQNGCLDVGDVQAVLAHWSQPADANRPLKSAVGAVSALFVVNSTGDQSDQLPGDGVCRTNQNNCTLRAAIEEANARPGHDTINFNVRNANGSCPSIVEVYPASELLIDDPYHDGMTIDGYSQCGASPNTQDIQGNAQIKVEIKGSRQRHVPAFNINTSNNVIRGLAIYNYDHQINLNGGANYNRIQGNMLGTDAANNFAQSNPRGEGVRLRYGPEYNIIGCGSYNPSTNEYQPCQTQAEFNAARNIVVGNKHGIYFDGDVSFNRIVGNYIGIKQDGETALGNTSDGLDFNYQPSRNWLGGPRPGEGNIISGNGHDGIELSHGMEVSENHIVGNYFGLNAAGTVSVPNGTSGVSLEDMASSNYFYNNVLSGNGANGIRVYVLSHSNQIIDNLIGVGPDGVTPMPNGTLTNHNHGRHGIVIMGGAQSNVIRNNVIANHPEDGIRMTTWQEARYGDFGATHYNTVSQNSIYNNQGTGILLLSGVNPATGETETAN